MIRDPEKFAPYVYLAKGQGDANPYELFVIIPLEEGTKVIGPVNNDISGNVIQFAYAIQSDTDCKKHFFYDQIPFTLNASGPDWEVHVIVSNGSDDRKSIRLIKNLDDLVQVVVDKAAVDCPYAYLKLPGSSNPSNVILHPFVLIPTQQQKELDAESLTNDTLTYCHSEVQLKAGSNGSPLVPPNVNAHAYPGYANMDDEFVLVVKGVAANGHRSNRTKNRHADRKPGGAGF